MIDFPFIRGQKYSFQELVDFELKIFKSRQVDKELSNRVRELNDFEWWWIKTRHEEMLPLLSCVRHNKISSEAMFCIMPEGHETDMAVSDGNFDWNIQITVADPAWPGTKKGSQHHLKARSLMRKGWRLALVRIG